MTLVSLLCRKPRDERQWKDSPGVVRSLFALPKRGNATLESSKLCWL